MTGGPWAPGPAPVPALPVTWHGEELLLRADRTLLWPEGRTLFAADLHLGKASVFRDRGVPIPEGAEAEDLGRLLRAVRETHSRSVVLLGDFVHGPESWTPELIRSLEVWRHRLDETAPGGVEVLLLPGNHDGEGARPPPEVRVGGLREGVQWGSFHLFHDPARASALPEATPALAGHLHPVVRLRGPGGRLRLPAFFLGERVGILPAFGSFTGGAVLDPTWSGDRFAVTPEGVAKLPNGG